MTRRDRDELGLDVEELDLDAWGNPAAPSTRPPSGAAPPGRPLAWLRAHRKQVVASIGAVAVFAAVLAIATGPRSGPGTAPATPPATSAPSTTERRPVATVPPATTTDAPVGGIADRGPSGMEIDYRFALDAVPDGFQVSEAQLVAPDVRGGPTAGSTFFATNEATWDTGPWLLVASSRAGEGPLYPFSRPPVTVPIGELTGRVGALAIGEMTTFADGDTRVSVIARGLEPLATVGLAEAITTTGNGGAAVAAAALPDGFRARPELDIDRWQSGWGAATRAVVSYQDPEHEASLSFVVRPLGATTWRDEAPFFLHDLRHLLVNGNPGVAGMFRSTYGGDPYARAVWERDDREYSAYGRGLSVDELIGHVSNLLQAGDDSWNSTRWGLLRQQAAACCSVPEREATAVGRGVVASVGDGWTATVEVGAQATWQLSPNGSEQATWWLGTEADAATPSLVTTSLADWSGDQQNFYAAAGAVVDRTMIGARLRLATTGTEPRTVEIGLAVVEGTPYLAAAAVVPWADGGFVAQLVGPDGQVLAVQTDAALS